MKGDSEDADFDQSSLDEDGEERGEERSMILGTSITVKMRMKSWTNLMLSPKPRDEGAGILPRQDSVYDW